MREQFETVICRTCDTNYRGAVKKECKNHDFVQGMTSMPEGHLKGKTAGYLEGLCFVKKDDGKIRFETEDELAWERKMLTASMIAKKLCLLMTEQKWSAPQGCDLLVMYMLIESFSSRELELTLDEFSEKYLKPMADRENESYPWIGHKYVQLPRCVDADNLTFQKLHGFEPDFTAEVRYENISLSVYRWFDIVERKFLLLVDAMIRPISKYGIHIGKSAN
jgi:hypothetical protein